MKKKQIVTITEEQKLAERLVNKELKLLWTSKQNGLHLFAFADDDSTIKPVQLLDLTEMIPGRSTRMAAKRTDKGHIILEQDEDGVPTLLACGSCGDIMTAARMAIHPCIVSPKVKPGYAPPPDKTETKKTEPVKRKRGRPRKVK